MSKETAEAIAKIFEAMQFDLEMGSHHLNNLASDTFSRTYPRLSQIIVKLNSEAQEVLEP